MRALIRAAMLMVLAGLVFAPIAIAQDAATDPEAPATEPAVPDDGEPNDVDEGGADGDTAGADGDADDAPSGWAVDSVVVYDVERKPGITFITIDPETADEPRGEGPATERVLELKLDLYLPVVPTKGDEEGDSEDGDGRQSEGDADADDTDDDGDGEADGEETVTPEDIEDAPPAELTAHHDGPYPLVIYIHGGGWKSGSRNAIGGFGEMFACAGFVCASIDYRLSPAWHAPAHVRDCKAALYFLRRNAEQYNLDPERVMVWGASAGGHLTMMLACTDPDDADGWMEPPLADGETEEDRAKVNGPIQCAVPFFGPSMLIDPERSDSGGAVPTVQGMLGLTPDDEGYEFAATAMSPVAHADKNDPPVLCVHGGRDRLVPPAHSEALVEALENAGAEPGYILHEEASHGLHRDARFAAPSWWAMFNWACAHLLDGDRREPLDANPFAIDANPYDQRASGGTTATPDAGPDAGDRSGVDEQFDAIVTRRFESTDADGDGALSREEWPGNPQAFDRLDADGDGAVSLDEFREAMEARRNNRRNRDRDSDN